MPTVLIFYDFIIIIYNVDQQRLSSRRTLACRHFDDHSNIPDDAFDEDIVNPDILVKGCLRQQPNSLDQVRKQVESRH
jgi:hypothetical protein